MNDCDKFTVKEFSDLVYFGAVIDDDGSAVFINQKGEEKPLKHVDDVYLLLIHSPSGQIHWFNK